MGHLWRSALLPTGIALFVLGVGNWVVSHNKIIEYTERTQPSNSDVPAAPFDEFSELTARTNATLLEPLHRGIADYSDAEAKLDFYRVVESGGRALVLLGLLLIALAGLWQRRRHRGVTTLRSSSMLR
jgi:LPXTG-motif cell wall-anchored protein